MELKVILFDVPAFNSGRIFHVTNKNCVSNIKHFLLLMGCEKLSIPLSTKHAVVVNLSPSNKSKRNVCDHDCSYDVKKV